jgi:hypothetical protein
VFVLVPFFPDRLQILTEFREFILLAGIMLFAVSIIGVIGALRRRPAIDL